MKLNLLNCAFRVRLGKVLGFMVDQRGIEANPEKINALLDMSSTRKPKEVMSLTSKIAALSHFVSQVNHCAPFFDMLKGSNKFEWMDKYEQAFLALQEHLGCSLRMLTILIKANRKGKALPIPRCCKEAVSTTLVKEKE